MRSKRNRVVGISIGSGKIALAEVRAGASRQVEVESLMVVDTPENAVNRGRIANSPAVSRAIRDMFASANLSGVKTISLAMPDEGNITRIQKLPSMSRNETLEALLGEVENYAAMAGGQPVIDYQSTGSTGEGGPQTEVMFLAVPREVFNSYLAALEGANVKPERMETIPLAALRAVKSLMLENEEKPVMLIAIEENVGMIIIFKGSAIHFIHDTEFGTGNLRGQMDYRRRELASEIRSSLDYYRNHFPDEGSVDKIILLANGPGVSAIAETLERFLNIPIIEPPVPGMENREELGETRLSAYAAIGAAARLIMRDDESINLLASTRGLEVVSLRKRVVMLLVAVLSLTLIAVGVRLYFGLQAEYVEEDLIWLQEQQALSEAEAQKQIPLLQTGIRNLKAQTEATDAAMNSIQWPNITRMYEEIRAIIPKSVWLISVSWSGNDVSFEGFGLSWDAVAKFYDVLVDSPYFDPVIVISEISTKIAEREAIRFRFNCGVKRDRLKGGAT